MFKKNGYSEKYIEKCLAQSELPPPDNTENDDKRRIYYGFPYVEQSQMMIANSLQRINKILKNCRLVAYFKTFKTQNYFKNKDKLSPNVSSSLVYKFECVQCSACYIGETRRHLQTRIKEHIRGHPQSEIAKHEHIPSPKNFHILQRTPHTKIAETLHIQKHKTNNRNLLNNFAASQPLCLFN